MKAEKLQLVKMLIETQDQSIIKQIKAIFEARQNKSNVWDEWDDEVRRDVEEAIRQADAGELIPHDKVTPLLKKWA